MKKLFYTFVFLSVLIPSVSFGAFTWTKDTGGTLSTSLVSYWAQEDLTDSFSANDQSGVNSPTFTAGKYNNALTLVAASSQYTNFSRTGFPTGTTNRSLAGWINLASLPTNDTYVFSYGTRANQQEWGIAIRSTGVLLFDEFGAGDVGTVNLIATTNTWIHLAFVYDGSANNIKVYVNGSLADTVSIANTLNTGVADWGRFGTRQDAGASTFLDGRLDEWGFWNKKLSAQEISDLYNSGTGSFYEEPTSFSPITSSTASPFAIVPLVLGFLGLGIVIKK